MSAKRTDRQSRVPGLDIAGMPGRYRLYARIAGSQDNEPKRVLVLDGEHNEFALVRDAQAAAGRLADLLPWTDPAALRARIDATADETARRALHGALIERLTGRALADLQAEADERRAAEEAWWDGTSARDSFDLHVRRHGHEPTWTRKGQRTFWGACPCGAQFRSSYRSVSRSFDRSGLTGPCPLSGQEG